jgi:hypothetical protein
MFTTKEKAGGRPALPQALFNRTASSPATGVSTGTHPHISYENTSQEQTTWLTYVNSLRWEKGFLDAASYASFLRAATLGIAPEVALQQATQRIQAAGDYPKSSKLSQQLRRAYAYAKNQDTASMPVQPTIKPQYIPSALEQYAAKLGFDATPSWLMQISPIVPWNKEPAYILQQLFKPEEKALVFSE